MAFGPPLLTLPAELRLQIYSYLYQPPEGQLPIEASLPIWGPAPIWIHRLELRHGDLHAACSSTKRAFWSILQVCKQVNREVTDLLFERVLFTIFVTNEKQRQDASTLAPRLGVARDFSFWQKTRRIVIIPMDRDVHPILELPRTIGSVLRCFKSTPHDTKVYLYMRKEHEFYMFSEPNQESQKRYERTLKSFSSLSKRAEFDIDCQYRDKWDYLDKLLSLAKAMHATATIVEFNVTANGVKTVARREIYSREEAAETTGALDDRRRQRVTCWMADSARKTAKMELAKRNKRLKKDRMSRA